MEVHPPEHGIHSLRDFLVHMGTITLGLLIALGLEGLVERAHHKHLVHTAHENLTAEVRTNRAILDDDEGYLRQAQRDLAKDLQTLHTLPNSSIKGQARLVASWTWDGPSDSAYSTARDTGALALMPYEEVQRIDYIYRQQHLVDNAATQYIDDMTRIHTPLGAGRTLAQLSSAEVDRMIEGCSATLIDIELLQALMRSLHQDYKNFDSQ
jgi:hypothetical protein